MSSLVLVGCGSTLPKDSMLIASNDAKIVKAAEIEVENKEIIGSQLPPLEQKVYTVPTKVSIIAVGDNLIHEGVYKSGKLPDGTYSFDYMYENVKDFISDKDIKVINQETVLVENPSSYSGYPCFGSPLAIGDAVRNVGFNVVTQATNHAYDKRETGILNSINYWKNFEDITYLGIHDSMEDYTNYRVIEKNGIKIGLLNYTYGLNGFKLPNDKQYLVDTLYDKNKIESDIKTLKTMSDFVIVFPHWGVEYTLKQVKDQENMAKFMADSGADLIIGAHPHVIEPLEYITSIDGRVVPCYYSLGNFISAQSEPERMLGAMAYVELEKDANGKVVISKSIAIPVVTHIEGGKYYSYYLKDYTNDLCAKHRLKLKGKSNMNIDYLEKTWNQVFPNDVIE